MVRTLAYKRYRTTTSVRVVDRDNRFGYQARMVGMDDSWGITVQDRLGFLDMLRMEARNVRKGGRYREWVGKQAR